MGSGVPSWLFLRASGGILYPVAILNPGHEIVELTWLAETLDLIDLPFIDLFLAIFRRNPGITALVRGHILAMARSHCFVCLPLGRVCGFVFVFGSV